MRRALGVLFACLALTACDYRGPLSPSTAPFVPLTITNLTASVDRTQAAFPVGPIVLTVRVQATSGSTEGARVDVAIRLDGLPGESGGLVVLGADGVGSNVFQFPRPGWLIARYGSLSQEIRITQDAPPPLPPAQPAPPPPPPFIPPPPSPPEPSIAVTLLANRTEVLTGEVVTFTASASANNGAGPATSYTWDFGDGQAITATNVTTRTYTTAATRLVRVVASNGVQSGTSNQVTITVTAPPPTPPAPPPVLPALLVSLSSATTTTLASPAVPFTATVTSSGSIPVTLIYDWSDDGSGDETYEATQTRTGAGVSQTATRDVPPFGTIGTKTVRVRVTDPATGRTAMTTRTITVQ